MAKTKKPNNETKDQGEVRRVLDSIANHATRSEKTAWNRKRDNLDRLMQKLRPLEDEILAIRVKMQPMYDDIAILRGDMAQDCIHPRDLLIHKGDHVECKFCSLRMRLININETV